MKKYLKVLFLFFCITQLNAQTTIGLIEKKEGSLNNGFVLFAPIVSNNTYLIDKCGKKMHTWTSNYKPALSCYILPDGTLLRTGNTNNTTFNTGGKGGIIQKIDWDGNVTWSYIICNATQCQHHDVKALPNGNVLVIAWESKTNTEAISEGRDPALVPNTVWSEQILEIEPMGKTGGNIVWEWHLWDHLVQDFDNSKANFGDINTNPQLINLNYKASATNTDWIHLNSIDYNPTLDQILVSSHSFNEIWIIDHSTKIAEAASHSGGNSGKGGDILYRWGNPMAYNTGTTTHFYGQHNAHWIESGLPYQNQIMVFNNGNGRTGGNYSTIEIINPPVNGYNYTATLPYLPNSTSWIYNMGNPNSLYAQNISGAQQLSNGNVLYCDGPNGAFTEIDSLGKPFWKYINPINNSGIMTQGTTPTQNSVFRCIFYTETFSGFTDKTFSLGETIESTNTITENCNPSSGIEKVIKNILIYPNPANDVINIQVNEFNSENIIIELCDITGKLVQKSSINEGNTKTYLDTRTLNSGVYIVKIISGNLLTTKKVIISK